MGVRGELFSSRVILPNRTYFFNVKENRMGDLYLNIVESKNRDNGGFDRQSVILFADDLQAFLGGFEESLKVMEKAVREKKHSGSAKREGGRREGGKRDGERRVVVRQKKENKPTNYTNRERTKKDYRGFHEKPTDKNS
ncbi:DUF3276 family protein [Treponema sp. R6D11]